MRSGGAAGRLRADMKMKYFWWMGLSGILMVVTISKPLSAQPAPSAAAGSSTSPSKALEALKDMKRDVLKTVDAAEKEEFDKKEVEAAYDRLIAVAERPLPQPRSKESDEALAKEVMGNLIGLPVALPAAALMADPEGGPVYILGRILQNQPYTANQRDIIPLTEILFAICDPKASAGYQQYIGSSQANQEKAENHLRFMLTIMNIGDAKAFAEGKDLLRGDRAKLQAWLLDLTKDANFKNEKVLREYKTYLRKKS